MSLITQIKNGIEQKIDIKKRSDIGRKYQNGILDMIIMINNEREANKQ